MKAAQSWLLLPFALMGLALVACVLPPSPTPSPVHTPTATAAPTAISTVTAPTPTPAPTPTLSLPTVADAIGWLRDAGLRVEPLEEAGEPLDGTAARVSVDGYDRVWIYAFDPPMSREAILYYFNVYADYTREAYPVVFNVENVTVLVRGLDRDVLEKVFVALWDRAPTHELVPFGVPGLQPSSPDAVPVAKWMGELAARWLQDQPRSQRLFETVSVVEARLVRLGDYTARFAVTEGPYPRLPHPDTIVWVVQARGEAGYSEGYATVLLDSVTYMVVGATFSGRRLAIEEAPEAPVPGPVELGAMDGKWNEHDELATILTWPEPPQVRIIPGVWHERVETYIIERAPGRFGPWETLAVVNRKGYSMTEGLYYLIAPPYGRAIISGHMDAANIKYWDWDVRRSVQYSYRVYGCTYLGRRTPYSNVAQAVAGDPLPDTPHPYARPSSTPVEPPC